MLRVAIALSKKVKTYHQFMPAENKLLMVFIGMYTLVIGILERLWARPQRGRLKQKRGVIQITYL